MNFRIKWLALLLFAILRTTLPARAQEEKTTIGGYGNAVYTRETQSGNAAVDLERMVVFIGHTFSPAVSLVSELELEDAKVTGGEAGGEVAFEQAYIQFSLDAGHRIVAGLFLPRIGILNENHLPTSFNGNERTQVETFVIPSTWRELGVGFYGGDDIFPFEYSIALVNGLNSSGFEHGSVIREGRFEGRNASAAALAVTGSIAKSAGNARVQVSGYYGGAAGLPPEEADTLHLRSGAFGTPVALGEADVQLGAGRLALRILGTVVSIPDAGMINGAFHNNTPKSAYGAYAEAAYRILGPIDGGEAVTAFLRYERLNMNSALPSNGVEDGSLDQHHLITGISYSPVPDVVLKTDVRFQWTGAPSLETGTTGGSRKTTYFTLGIGFAY